MNTSAPWMRLVVVVRTTVLALLLALSAGAKAVPTEYEVKAAFLYNFIAFTEWPETAFEQATSPIVIGILGKDPFGASLDAMMKGERVKNRPLIVWRVSRLEDLTRCHILFVSDSEAKQLGEILNRVKTQPVLTVSDMTGFAEAGGAVGFVTADSVKLTINPRAIQTARLALSAKLFRLARLVEAKETPR